MTGEPAIAFEAEEQFTARGTHATWLVEAAHCIRPLPPESTRLSGTRVPSQFFQEHLSYVNDFVGEFDYAPRHVIDSFPDFRLRIVNRAGPPDGQGAGKGRA